MTKKQSSVKQSTISFKRKPKWHKPLTDYSKSIDEKELSWANINIASFGANDPWIKVNVFGGPKPPKKPINGAKKGKQYEREVANAIGHIFPEAQRNLEYQANEDQGLDIRGTDRIKIQCKFRQNYVPINTIREIQLKNKNEIPVLVTKGNHREAMAVLPFDKLVTLLEIAYGLELPFRTFDIESVKLPYVEAKALPMTHDFSALLDDLI